MFKQILGAAALLITLPLAVQAGDYTRTEYVTVSQPRQQCWNEQVAVSGHNNDGAIVGGIAGGIIGNQVGRGNGRVAATAVGAVTGAIVGERLSGNGGVQYRTVQRCNTVYEQVRVPRTVTYTTLETNDYPPQSVIHVNSNPHRHGHHCGHEWRNNEWREVKHHGHHHRRHHGHHGHGHHDD